MPHAEVRLLASSSEGLRLILSSSRWAVTVEIGAFIYLADLLGLSTLFTLLSIQPC